MLCMAPCFGPLISIRHTFFYHQDGSASRILVATLLNVLCLWLIFASLFLFAERSERTRFYVWTCFLSLLPCLLLRSYGMLSGWAIRFPIFKLSFVAGLALLAVCLLCRRHVMPHFARIQGIAALLIAFVSISWCFTLGQLTYYAWKTQGLNAATPFGAAQVRGFRPPSAAPHRIVWILLDELAYEQLFPGRLPGLQLSAFDRLAAESTIFSQASAPGLYTEQVIPQFINGHPATAVKSTLTGQLLSQDADGIWRRFQPQDSVFDDALHGGYHTAIVGWHNPYCRLLNPVLDQCFWRARTDSATPEFDGDASFAKNLLGPLRRFWETLCDFPWERRVDRSDEERYSDRHIEDVRALFRASDALLADPSLNFVFLHMPVPHPWGIYDRQKSRFTDQHGSSYADNLALADQYLAHVRGQLEHQGEWDNATVLVMGDHSWRTKLLWEAAKSWTPEDQRASHGGAYDPRPALLLKLPYQHGTADVAAPFSTVRIRSLLDQIMQNHIRTPADLQTWTSGTQPLSR